MKYKALILFPLLVHALPLYAGDFETLAKIYNSMHKTRVIDGIEVHDSHGMWQDKETRKIHSAEGYVFEYVGRYLSIDSLPDKPIYKDCSEADFYGDPNTVPPPDFLLVQVVSLNLSVYAGLKNLVPWS